MFASRAYTINEILITLALSSFLLTGVIKLYQVNHQHYLAQEALNNIQVHGRVAVHALQSAIRMAGYFGCESHRHFTLGKAKSGSAIMSTQQMSLRTTTLLQAMTHPKQLMVPRDFTVRRKQKLVIADCQHYEILTVAKLNKIRGSGVRVTTTAPLNYLYPQYAKIGEYQTRQFFIGDTKRHANQKALHALYVKLNNRRHELSPNIDYIRAVASEKGVTITLSLHSRRIQQQWPFYVAFREPTDAL